MGRDRLNLLLIHWNIALDPMQIIARFVPHVKCVMISYYNLFIFILKFYGFLFF